MAKITELPPAAPLTGSETIPIIQAGVTRQSPVSALTAAVAADAVAAADRSEAARDIALTGTQYPSAAAAAAAISEGAFASYLVDGLPTYGQKTGGVMVALPGPWIASEKIGWQQSGASAQPETVDAKLKRVALSPDEYKTALDADDTNCLKKAFDHALANRRALRLSRDYAVSGPIASIATVAAGSIDIECIGNCTITVAPGAAAFDYLIFLQTNANNSVSITGGALTVNLNERCGSGLYIRHLSLTPGGACNIAAPVRIIGAKQNNALTASENAGIMIIGDYLNPYLNSPRVEGVTRANLIAGACKGIAVSGYSGDCLVLNPHIERVIDPSGIQDADALALFAKGWATSQTQTPGTATVIGGVFIDCQGRSIKSQCSQTAIIRPVVKRRMVVAIPQCVEFDFQSGGGLVLEPDIEYRTNGGVSPIGSSHSVVSFQHHITDMPSIGKMVGGTLRTEVAIPRVASHKCSAASAGGTTIIDGLRVIPIGAFAGAAFTRGIVEVNCADIEPTAGKNRIEVNNVRGPLGVHAIAYTGYAGGTGVIDGGVGTLHSKFSWSVTNLDNTYGGGSPPRTCATISGPAIPQFERFKCYGNSGYRDLLTSLTFSMATIDVGSVFTVDIASCNVTNPPAWGSSGYAIVECKNSYLGGNNRTVEVTKMPPSAANTMFLTYDGGASWVTTK